MQVIDRKKDLVKLQNGEYIALGKVEMAIKECGLVDNACVYADSSKSFSVALVMVNRNQLETFAQKSIKIKIHIHSKRLPSSTSNLSKCLDGIEGTFEDLCANPLVENGVLTEIQKHLMRSQREKIIGFPKAIKLVTDVWTPETGLVTAAFKVIRKNIQLHYQQMIEDMYSNSTSRSSS